ncbi:PaaI family thioesterase [Pseudooceanicola sp.]|uniref:PaaI family thioesterase n=1 Tax=Pseudooceanicola sp. TaxID=1914328 RepID=UPI00262898DE|nr:PaaI family thioesterase [Pseudooceanicola sp.]MDF1854492.1 PaaI family thioesterase [Pseudooceanicola sp.]
MDDDRKRRIAQQFMEGLPHARALSIQLESTGAGEVTMTLPYDARLVGDPSTGVLHGGAVSTLMDTCCGAAVMTHPDAPGVTATIDLRIEYMRPALAGRAITACATCHHITRSVAFVRAIASDGDDDRPVATASGAFSVGGGGV